MQTKGRKVHLETPVSMRTRPIAVRYKTVYRLGFLCILSSLNFCLVCKWDHNLPYRKTKMGDCGGLGKAGRWPRPAFSTRDHTQLCLSTSFMITLILYSHNSPSSAILTFSVYITLPAFLGFKVLRIIHKSDLDILHSVFHCVICSEQRLVHTFRNI